MRDEKPSSSESKAHPVSSSKQGESRPRVQLSYLLSNRRLSWVTGEGSGVGESLTLLVEEVMTGGLRRAQDGG